MKPLTLTVVSAGLGLPSSTGRLAKLLATATEKHLAGASPLDVVSVELRDLAVAVAARLVSGSLTDELRAAVEAVVKADGLIAVTPVFTASYSGVFKSFFDLLGEAALDGVPVLIAASGGTARHTLALEHAMRPMFTHLGAHAVRTTVYAAPGDWGSDRLEARIDRAARELAAALPGGVSRVNGDRSCRAAGTAVPPSGGL
ncbi:FMN reductase [Sinosporangium album]|uniref:FMN reductase n=1 Tax=Sinosporangium album TaxID=504805 RepID=A0A1G8GHC7_9ACTN|nr:CE1759 family FMN reductase [Sinosporangium album]SDH93785.1 FMN reductase [Sinosporangium album]